MDNTPTEAGDALAHAVKMMEEGFKNVPDGTEMVQRLSERFSAAYRSPPVEDFEFLLNKRFSNDEVRIALFKPREEQFMYYSLILSLTAALPADHKLDKIKSLVLTLMFLVHKKSWKFLEEFVSSDGLYHMVPMLADKNLYVRGQVMEIYISITDCDSYDWFAEAITLRDKIVHQKMLQLSQHPAFLNSLIENRTDSYPGGSMRALQLLAFWLSWVRKLYTEDSRLKLSAKLVSELFCWATVMTPDDDEEELKLAKQLYEDFGYLQFQQKVPTSSTAEEASDVAVVRDYEASAPALAELSVSGVDASSLDTTGLETEEEKAARHSTSSVPPLPAIEGLAIKAATGGGAAEGTKKKILTFEEEFKIKLAEGSEFKILGNSFFKVDNYRDALINYRNGVTVAERLETSINVALANDASSSDCAVGTAAKLAALRYELAEFSAALHTNIATTLWKVGHNSTETAQQELVAASLLFSANHTAMAFAASKTEKETEKSEVIASKLLDECLKECNLALAVQPHNIKAVYRKASVLLEQEEPTEALSIVDCTMAFHSKGTPSSSSSPLTRTTGAAAVGTGTAAVAAGESTSILKQMRNQCVAALIFEDGEGEDESKPLTSYGLNKEVATVLRDILKRNKRENALANPKSSAAAAAVGQQSKNGSNNKTGGSGGGCEEEEDADEEMRAAIAARAAKAKLDAAQRIAKEKYGTTAAALGGGSNHDQDIVSGEPIAGAAAGAPVVLSPEEEEARKKKLKKLKKKEEAKRVASEASIEFKKFSVEYCKEMEKKECSRPPARPFDFDALYSKACKVSCDEDVLSSLRCLFISLLHILQYYHIFV